MGAPLCDRQAYPAFQSPRGDFGFLKMTLPELLGYVKLILFQSPRGDFGFLKLPYAGIRVKDATLIATFQSPRGDFGFLKESSS